MAREPLLKIYGHIYPVSPAFYADLEQACRDALPDEPSIPVLEQDGDMARISFEGIYFPVDAVTAAVRRHLHNAHHGKLDVLDLENWRLTRYTCVNGALTEHSAPLNNVLAYSGH